MLCVNHVGLVVVSELLPKLNLMYLCFSCVKNERIQISFTVV